MTATMLPQRSWRDCPPRWSSNRQQDRPTYGDRVAQIAEVLGTPLMPWQRHVADVALEVDPATGRLAYRTVVLTVPRQQGKTALLLAVWLQRALGFGGKQNIAWTMQSALEARQKWEDEHVPALMASPLAGAVRKVRRTNGSEAVLFANGSNQQLMASTSSSGHGKSLDLGVVDEAFAFADDRLEVAIRPAMRTRPEPQFWIVSTMGDAASTWFHGWVEAGRAIVDAGQRSDVAFFEWSAPEDADPADPATWWACSPAMGHTITEDVLRSEYASAVAKPDGLAAFRRSSLNQRTTQRADPAIPRAWWDACAVTDSAPCRPMTCAVDVALDRSAASIASAWRRVDGRVQLEVDWREGVDWLDGRIAEVDARWSPRWLLDPRSPAVTLLGAREWVAVTPAEQAQAAGSLFDCVQQQKVAHIAQVPLAVALDGAAKRPVGDGAWTWSRRTSVVDISPLVAVTLAHHGAATSTASSDPMLAVW
jgi:hypothetical protein